MYGLLSCCCRAGEQELPDLPTGQVAKYLLRYVLLLLVVPCGEGLGTATALTDLGCGFDGPKSDGL